MILTTKKKLQESHNVWWLGFWWCESSSGKYIYRTSSNHI